MIESKKFNKGEVIFTQGQWEMWFYSVKSGKVGIYAGYGSDKEVLLTELEAGKYFGEMGVLEAMPRSATAVALEDCDLEVIEKEDMGEYFSNNSEKIIDLFQNLTSRLRELSQQYIDTCHVIADYVEAEEKNKPKQGLFDKIKALIAEADEYYALYTEAASKDPFYRMNNYHGWY